MISFRGGTIDTNHDTTAPTNKDYDINSSGGIITEDLHVYETMHVTNITDSELLQNEPNDLANEAIELKYYYDDELRINAHITLKNSKRVLKRFHRKSRMWVLVRVIPNPLYI